MMFYRTTGNGPQLTIDDDRPTGTGKALGYMAEVGWGPGWHQYLVIDRTTRRYYLRTAGPRTTVREISRFAARQVFNSTGKPTLRPVMH
jgi:hypothetical protein